MKPKILYTAVLALLIMAAIEVTAGEVFASAAKINYAPGEQGVSSAAAAQPEEAGSMIYLWIIGGCLVVLGIVQLIDSAGKVKIDEI